MRSFACALALAGCIASPEQPDPDPIIMTDAGPVRGIVTADGALAFRGIPYAAPPVGELRWRAPAPPVPWQDVRDATDWGAYCIQLIDVGVAGGSEDCLFVNVWTPAERGPEPLPVLFFIHGGSNVSGSSSDPWNGVDVYDGSYAAAHGPAVVVTINYRLAAMGFLAHTAFASENEHAAAGNYAILDQIAALQWVQRNIAAFGGDPARVLVFGQSAGAYDTCSLVTSPLAAGLFSRALLMSGGCSASSRTGAAANADLVAQRLGCSDAACLRGKTAEEVTLATGYYEIGNGSFFGQSVDGYVQPQQPQHMIATGAYNHMPLVVGTTADEMSQFIWFFIEREPKTEAQYRADVEPMFGSWTDQVLAEYPTAEYGTQMAALQALLADWSFICTSRDLVLAAASAQTEPVRRYVFAHAFDNPRLAPDGAAHGYDVFFALHNLGGTVIEPTPGELALGDAMLGTWTRFAATGDAAGWPTYDAATHQHLTFDESISVGDDDRTAQCDFWDALYGPP